MAILRTVKCSICGCKETEPEYGKGWSGWIHIVGVVLNGDSNVYLCPAHMKKVMDYIDALGEVS